MTKLQRVLYYLQEQPERRDAENAPADVTAGSAVMEKTVCREPGLLKWREVEEIELDFFVDPKRTAENFWGTQKCGDGKFQDNLRGSDD